SAVWRHDRGGLWCDRASDRSHGRVPNTAARGQWPRHPPRPPDFSPLYEAIREQLGLQLKRGGKGAVDHLVIGSVKKPTSN
ncbi:MAG TPA: hypothetical protein VIC32_08070, partial [Terriglobales bacterium]